MAHLILFLVLILFVIWVLWPFFKKQDENKNDGEFEKTLYSERSKFRDLNAIFVILSAVIVLSLFLWLLPKFGINLLSLFQKILTLISTLRGILPF